MESDLEQLLEQYLSAPAYEPQDISALARGMGIDSRRRKELRALLQSLLEQGKLLKLSKARYALRKPAGGAVNGRIIRRDNGKLLFLPDSAGEAAIRSLCPTYDGGPLSLPERDARDAMDGDRVRASVRLHRTRGHRRRAHRSRRPEAGELTLQVRVEEIAERGHNRWVGIYHSDGHYGYMHGDGKTAPERVRLTTPPPPELLPFMSILVEPLTRPIAKTEATGRIISVLGWPNDAGVQVTTVIHQYELPDSFPQEVLDESSAIPDALSPQDLLGRDDWRTRCVITIDPATARDFDDAVAVRRISGGWELAVHIADVSHYVKPGSALDREAMRRGNSTYLPDRVLPMLPPRLCDGICSLRQGEDRLTRLCLMQIDESGRTVKADFRDAVICSRLRMSYPEALAVLEHRTESGDTEVDAMLAEAHTLAQLLRQQRFSHGALNLDMPELQVVTDEHGFPVDVLPEESDIAHQLIEEFMLAANEAVAHALNAHAIPTVYRVHEAPDSAKLQEFSELLKSYGIPVGHLATRTEVVRVMEKLRGHADEPLLKLALLRCMMRACYAPKASGHYGLAKGDYCHFTSPIRRYADLVVHRGFSRLSGGKSVPLPSAGKLEEISRHLSERERISASAENEAEQKMLLLYMEHQCSAEQPREWDAVVTALWAQGVVVELPLLRLKGFISAAELPGSSRQYPTCHAGCRDARFGACLRPGDTLRVIPVNIDPATGFLDLRPA
ncbi:MAG: VacB/RNase II family 3'-5' exoribonuclease [Akkermansia sp.]|nr:VacB/RNase II family 3'-5' exoribonuclease [Akkermansia sp.]